MLEYADQGHASTALQLPDTAFSPPMPAETVDGAGN